MKLHILRIRVSSVKHFRELSALAAEASNKSVFPEPASPGKTHFSQHVPAPYPHEITGFKKFFEHCTLFYPNKVPIHCEGLDKWRPGCGSLRMWHMAFGESTVSRFDENSKLIVVDGPRMSGKTTVAKELAERLNMRYIPEVTNVWEQETQMDGRVLPDWKWNDFTSMQKFYEDPLSACGHSARLQGVILHNRFRQYIWNSLHLLGTGQGVVMEKSIFNNWADKDALLAMNYINPQFHGWLTIKENFMFPNVMPPHLLIYLDVSPEETYSRMQEKGTAFEKKVDKKYLEAVDKYNKQHLPELNKQFNTVTIQYDWNKPGNVEQILDDFELLDFSGIAYWKEFTDEEFFLHRLKLQQWKKREYKWMSYGRARPETTFTANYSSQLKKERKEMRRRRGWYRTWPWAMPSY